MIPSFFRKLEGAAALVVLLLALAGCGRNGPLEAPPGATPATTASSETPAAVAVNPPSASPDAHSTAPPSIAPPPTAKPAAVTPVFNSFLLDPLVN